MKYEFRAWAPSSVSNISNRINSRPMRCNIEQTRFYFCSQATGMTPLMYAVKDNRTSLLDKLIDLGSDVGARNNVSRNHQLQLCHNHGKDKTCFIITKDVKVKHVFFSQKNKSLKSLLYFKSSYKNYFFY